MICIDASLVVKLLFIEEYSDQTLALVDEQSSAGQSIVAPVLLQFEIANSIRRRMVQNSLTMPLALVALSDFQSQPIEYHHSTDLAEKALSLSDAYALPTTYDAHYVALAQLLDCTLWTDDRRLLRNLGGRLPFVKWIGDYTPGQPI